MEEPLITLAWATPVRPDQLGAGLEAYCKIRPTLRLLGQVERHLLKYSKGLPAETIKMIKVWCYRLAFEEVLTSSEESNRCCSEDCDCESDSDEHEARLDTIMHKIGVRRKAHQKFRRCQAVIGYPVL